MRLNFDVRSSYPPAPLLQAGFFGYYAIRILIFVAPISEPARTTDAAGQAAIN